MKKVIFSAALLMGFVTISFAGTPKGETKEAAPEAKAPAKVETQALRYWFDANTGEYLGRKESAGCDESNSQPCANGYTNVATPSNPQEPTGTPDQIEHGKR